MRASAGSLLSYSVVSFDCNSVTISVTNNDGSSPHSGTVDVTRSPNFGQWIGSFAVLPSSTTNVTVSFSPVASGQLQAFEDSDTSDTATFYYTCNLGGSVPPAPSGFVGPAIPGDFVLRTITCNTPVYAAAGGIPVPTGEKITAGQTWFVNPKPVTIGKTSWTEFFDGGYINGFIPTACVGDKPAGYMGA
jgi:hypothetical protein